MKTFDAIFEKPSIPLGRKSFFLALILAIVINLLITRVLFAVGSKTGLIIFHLVLALIELMLAYRRILDFKTAKVARNLMIVFVLFQILSSLFVSLAIKAPIGHASGFVLALPIIYLINLIVIISLIVIPGKATSK